MATNSGRGNPIAATDGKNEVVNQPPPVSQDLKAEVSEASQSVHSAGKDAGAASLESAGPKAPAGPDQDQEQGSQQTPQ